mmetsp:Transcript_16107/g.35505  ORF Transcript_16107/g.35505 Transcript_16107/m.35505 type:complete len:339 (-) Transcript_16107:1312-2328(-)
MFERDGTIILLTPWAPLQCSLPRQRVVVTIMELDLIRSLKVSWISEFVAHSPRGSARGEQPYYCSRQERERDTEQPRDKQMMTHIVFPQEVDTVRIVHRGQSVPDLSHVPNSSVIHAKDWPCAARALAGRPGGSGRIGVLVRVDVVPATSLPNGLAPLIVLTAGVPVALPIGCGHPKLAHDIQPSSHLELHLARREIHKVSFVVVQQSIFADQGTVTNSQALYWMFVLQKVGVHFDPKIVAGPVTSRSRSHRVLRFLWHDLPHLHPIQIGIAFPSSDCNPIAVGARCPGFVPTLTQDGFEAILGCTKVNHSSLLRLYIHDCLVRQGNQLYRVVVLGVP